MDEKNSHILGMTKAQWIIILLLTLFLGYGMYSCFLSEDQSCGYFSSIAPILQTMLSPILGITQPISDQYGSIAGMALSLLLIIIACYILLFIISQIIKLVKKKTTYDEY